MAFKTETAQVTTTSTSFVAMPGSGRVITTTVAGCIIVEFSGEETAALNTNRMLIRAATLGGLVAEPPSVRVGYPFSPGNYETRAMRFIFKNVPPGQHNVRIEWLSQSGGNVYVQNRTLAVSYR